MTPEQQAAVAVQPHTAAPVVPPPTAARQFLGLVDAAGTALGGAVDCVAAAVVALTSGASR